VRQIFKLMAGSKKQLQTAAMSSADGSAIGKAASRAPSKDFARTSADVSMWLSALQIAETMPYRLSRIREECNHTLGASSRS
jgi:hypothetical protein